MSTDIADLLNQMQRNTFTRGAMYRRLGILRECVEDALFTETDMSYLQECESFLKEQHASEDDIQAVLEWGSHVFLAFTQSNVSAHMKALHEAVTNAPILNIYFPVALPEADIAQVGQWCRENHDPAVFLEVHIDPQVVGGCAFVRGDVYTEISYRTRSKEQSGLVTSILSAYAAK